MDKAWSTLQELGAVDKESKLTALGRYMASSRHVANRLPSHSTLGYASFGSKTGQGDPMRLLTSTCRCLIPPDAGARIDSQVPEPCPHDSCKFVLQVPIRQPSGKARSGHSVR